MVLTIKRHEESILEGHERLTLLIDSLEYLIAFTPKKSSQAEQYLDEFYKQLRSHPEIARNPDRVGKIICLYEEKLAYLYQAA